MRIIDVHTHPIFFNDGRREDEIDALVAHGRALGVERMISLGDVLRYGPRPDAAQLRRLNNESARLQKLHPDYFVGFCYLNPLLGEKAVMTEAERCVTKFGFKGIKLEIANNASHACMKHIMKAARTFGYVVLQHSWSSTNFGPNMQDHSDPEDTAGLARRHPDVNIIMAHMVGVGYRGVIAAKGLPNVFVDTSGGFPEDGLVEYAVEHLGADNVIYGSDLPIRESSTKIGSVLGARIPESAKAKILFHNTARLLNLN
ncbi:MAG: amidohydrolase family protein [Opitutaceae bacterium]|nr:amidohydrolase family protein [Cephaloticoccus sp.]MCP5529994.1 amidohydrolase family protein [Opitutaceae bacterium]